jgi:hypothetical protein
MRPMVAVIGLMPLLATCTATTQTSWVDITNQRRDLGQLKMASAGCNLALSQSGVGQPLSSSETSTPGLAVAAVGTQMINQQNFIDQCMLVQGWEERVVPVPQAAGAQAVPQTNYQRGLAANGANDYPQAMLWWRKAADQGDAEAQAAVGWLYFNGRGVPKDYSQAMLWFRKAADQGNAGAQNNIGVLYQNGWGTPKDNEQARYWFLLAAAQGEPNATKSLGQLALDKLQGASTRN